MLELMLRGSDGLDLLRVLRERYPNLPALVISVQDEEIFSKRAQRAGTKGYLMRHAASEEFGDAIRAMLAGEIYVSRKINARMLRRLASSNTAPGDNVLHTLSDRELQIFQLIGILRRVSASAPRRSSPTARTSSTSFIWRTVSRSSRPLRSGCAASFRQPLGSRRSSPVRSGFSRSLLTRRPYGRCEIRPSCRPYIAPAYMWERARWHLLRPGPV